MLVTAWNAVVIILFDHLSKDVDNVFVSVTKNVITIGPCYFIGIWVSKLQKHFDL